MLKNFSRSLILSATLLLGVVTPVQAKTMWDEIGPHRGSGRNNIGPSELNIPLTPHNAPTQQEGPTKEPNELLWSPKATRIVNQ